MSENIKNAVIDAIKTKILMERDGIKVNSLRIFAYYGEKCIDFTINFK